MLFRLIQRFGCGRNLIMSELFPKKKRDREDIWQNQYGVTITLAEICLFNRFILKIHE